MEVRQESSMNCTCLCTASCLFFICTLMYVLLTGSQYRGVGLLLVRRSVNRGTGLGDTFCWRR
jgi:hypothetical protein